jgi:hypothetical protein
MRKLCESITFKKDNILCKNYKKKGLNICHMHCDKYSENRLELLTIFYSSMFIVSILCYLVITDFEVFNLIQEYILRYNYIYFALI